jgi:hypothetical protein
LKVDICLGIVGCERIEEKWQKWGMINFFTSKKGTGKLGQKWGSFLAVF